MFDQEEDSKRGFPLFEFGCILVFIIIAAIIMFLLLAPAISNVFELGWFF